MSQTPQDRIDVPAVKPATKPSAPDADDGSLSDEELDKVSGGMAAEIAPRGHPSKVDTLL